MTTDEFAAKENLLTGKSDFVGWFIKLQAQLEAKGYMDENGKINTNSTSPVMNYERKTYNCMPFQVMSKGPWKEMYLVVFDMKMIKKMSIFSATSGLRH